MIQTTHKLEFEARPYLIQLVPGFIFQEFRVGKIEGLFCPLADVCQILAVKSSSPGSGHMQDVLQWFEGSPKIPGYKIIFLDILNPRFYDYLVRQGYAPDGKTKGALSKIL